MVKTQFKTLGNKKAPPLINLLDNMLIWALQRFGKDT